MTNSDQTPQQRPEKRNLRALVGVRLLPDEHERALQLARNKGVTLPALLRQMLNEHLAEA